MLVAGYPYLTESTFLALNNSIGDRVFIYDPLDYNLSELFQIIFILTKLNRHTKGVVTHQCGKDF